MRVTTDADIAMIRQLAGESLILQDIAKRVGMGPESVRYHIVKHKIKCQRGRRKYVRPDFIKTESRGQVRRAINYFNERRICVIHAELDDPPGPRGMFHFGKSKIPASGADLVRWAG